MIFTRIILICSLFISSFGYAQEDPDISALIRTVFHEKGAITYWQIDYEGYSESGEKVWLSLAYDEKLYIAYLQNSTGTHFFEGSYNACELKWVEYEDERIAGYLNGWREQGIISAVWMDARKAEGRQLFLVKKGMENHSAMPKMGAIFLLSGDLKGHRAEIMIDWYPDGRIKLLLYENSDDTPLHFTADGFMAAAEIWSFHSGESRNLVELSSPLRNTTIDVQIKKENSGPVSGNFKIDYKLEKVMIAANKSDPVNTEFLKSGIAVLDKKMRSELNEWKNKYPVDDGEVNVWFEASDIRDNMIFGQWWRDDDRSENLFFKSMVLDLKNGQVYELSDLFDVDKPEQLAASVQLTMNEGMLCWAGPKNRITGVESKCLEKNVWRDLVEKRFRDRIIQ